MSAYAGIRVADFSQGVAGPMAAMLLGDFDAEVIKVEPPGGGRAGPSGLSGLEPQQAGPDPRPGDTGRAGPRRTT